MQARYPPGTRPQRLGKGLLAMLVLLFLYRRDGKVRAQLRELYGADLVGVRWEPAVCTS